MAIKLYKSQATIDTKSTNVSATQLAVSPSSVYSSAKASAGAADAAVNLFAVIKKTKDDSKATAINNDIESKMNKMAINYDRSNNPEDLTTFNSMMSLVKDKAILGSNNSVKRKVNSWFASKLSSSSLDLEKNITNNIIDEKIATDKIELEKYQGIIATSNNRKEVNQAKGWINNYFANENNKLFYKPADWITLQDEQENKIQENAAIMLATNDPNSVIDNPKIITDNIKDTETAEYILEKAYENSAANVEAEIKDMEIIDAKNLEDQANNFAELAVRIKDFHENANNQDFSDKLITYSELKRAYVNNDIDETMYRKLIDYRAGTIVLDDERLVADINDEIINSDSPVELQALSKRVQVKDSDLSFLNLSAESTGRALKKINLLKKDSELYTEYKTTTSIMKAIFFASDSYEFDVGEDSRTVKAVGGQAMEYFDNLVINQGMNVTDAMFKTITKFNPGAALPNMTIFPLPAFSEESDWTSQILAHGGSGYFIKAKDKMANLYKDGKLNHEEFMFEIENLNKAERLFQVRHKYAISVSKATDDMTDENVLTFAAGEGASGLSSIIKNLMKKD
jgi:hypothetical protein